MSASIADMPPVHPAAELFPMMPDEDLRQLADDIAAVGLQQPIVMMGGYLLDGRNRWRACQLAGVEPKVRDWSGDSPTAYVLSLNLRRRHLTAAQKAAAAAKAAPMFEAEAKKRQRAAGGDKRSDQARSLGDKPSPTEPRDESQRATAQAAKATGAGVKATQTMNAVRKAAPEVVELVQRGGVKTVSDAKRIAALPVERRAEVVSHVESGFSVADAMAKVRAQREEPIGALIAAVENVRKHAVAVRGSCERLEDLCSRMSVTDMRSPEFLKAGMSLLQARSDISKAIELLRAEENDK